MSMGNKPLLFLILFFFGFIFPKGMLAQNNLSYQPELVLGHVVPNFQDYPSSGLLYGVGLALHTPNTGKNLWQRQFPNGETGIYIGAWNMGNDSIFGNEIAVYPYIQFPFRKKAKTPLFIRVGLGTAHFSKFYSATKNLRNTAVGSGFTWAFEASLRWSKPISDRLDLSLAGKFIHGSNGHIQLPNFGINSAALSIGVHYAPKPQIPKTELEPIKRSKHHLIQVITGIGLHEFGGTDGPVGGPKYGISSLAAYHNIQFNHRNRLKLGLVARQYNAYAQYIDTHDLDKKYTPYSVSFILGHEFLIGHLGLDVDGLLHLYKPFYRIYYDKFGTDSKTLFLLHRWLGARIGLNAYAISPAKNPKTNVFLGVHLNTNNGEADFSSISIGLERELSLCTGTNVPCNDMPSL